MRSAFPKRDRTNHRQFGPRLEALEARLCLSLASSEYQVNTVVEQDQAESANASSANGSHVVVWTDHSTGNANIKAQRYQADGQRLGGEIVVADAFLDEHQPDVAMDSEGNFVVVWTVNGEDVVGARFSADGARIDDFTVADGDSLEFDPSVATWPDGSFFVSHTILAGSFLTEDGLFDNHDVVLTSFASDGVPYDSWSTSVATYADDRHSRVDASENALAIVYDRTAFMEDAGTLKLTPGVRSIFIIDHYDNGQLVSESFGFIGLEGNYNSHPDVALNTGGDAVVALQSGDPSNGTAITAVRISPGFNGHLVVPNMVIASAAGLRSHPAVALDDNGKFVVAYQSGTGNPSVQVREVSASDVVGVNYNLGEGRGDPAVSIGGDHRYLATYTKEDGEVLFKSNPPLDAPSGTGVFLRRGSLSTQRPITLKPPTQIYFNEGVLKLLGSALDNKVELTGYGDNIAITADGIDRGVYSDVRRVEVQLSDGRDSLTVFLPYIEQKLTVNVFTAAGADDVNADIGLVAAAFGLNLNLGGGNDVCQITHSAGFADGGHWNLKLAAGAGDDAVRFLAPLPDKPAETTPAVNASFLGEFNLEAGNDIDGWGWDMPVDVRHDVVIRGGPGHDTDIEHWSDMSAPVTHRWEGNDGNDTQQFTLSSVGVDDIPTVIGRLTLASDGGRGIDSSVLELKGITVGGQLTVNQVNESNQVSTDDASGEMAVNGALTLTQTGITNAVVTNWSVAPEGAATIRQTSTPGGNNSIIAILKAAAGSMVEFAQTGQDSDLDLNAVIDGSLRVRQLGTDEYADRLRADCLLLGSGEVDMLMSALGGDDELTFHVGRFGKFLSFQAFGDGGDGEDVAFGSLNVEFINCEEVHLPE